MLVKYIGPLWGLMALLCALPVYALGLGELSIQSGLGEPLLAEIEVASANSGELETLDISLGSGDDFSNAGIIRQKFLTELEFEVVDADRAVIRIRSDQPIVEPFLQFVIRARWDSGEILSEYTALLDPPLYAGQQPDSVNSPVMLEEVEQPATSAGLNEPESLEGIETVATDQAQQPTSATDLVSGVQYGPVKRGDTLWAIATQIDTGDLEVNEYQIMMALLNSNPEAFVDNNVNRLRVGETLYLKDINEILSISRAEASRAFQAQLARWESGRAATVTSGKPADVPLAEPRVGTQVSLSASSDYETGIAPPVNEPVEKFVFEIAPPTPRDETGESVAPPDTEIEIEAMRAAFEREISSLKEHVIEIETKNKQLEAVALAGAGAAAEPATAADGTAGTPRPVQSDSPASPPESGAAAAQQINTMREQMSAMREQITAMKAAEIERDLQTAKLEQRVAQLIQILQDSPETTVPATPVVAESDATPVVAGSDATPVVAEGSESPAVPERAETDAEGPGILELSAPIEKKRFRIDTRSESPPFWETWLDEMSRDNLQRIAIAGATLLLLVALWILIRRRRSLMNFEDSILNGSVFGAEASKMPGTETMKPSEISELNTSDMGQIEADEIDPLAEADVYMAYGRVTQAVDVLKEASTRDPERYELNAKLLEIYGQEGDEQSFDALVSELNLTEHDANPILWSKVVALRLKMHEDSPLESSDIEENNATSASPPHSEGSSDWELPLQQATDEEEGGSVQTEEGSELHGDITNRTSGAVEPTLHPFPQPDRPVGIGATDFSVLAAELRDDPPVRESQTMFQSADSDMLNFTTGDETVMDFAPDPGSNEPPESPGTDDNEAVQWNEVAIKVELAQAYLNMGEKEEALNILQEIGHGSNPEQKTMIAGLMQQAAQS